MKRRAVYIAAALLLWGAKSAESVTMWLATDVGDTTFFAPPGDTVSIAVAVDSEGESLTGVELFLSFDPNLFRAIDADTASGIQPAASDNLLGDILADTLLVVGDSLALVHYAETDLGGREINGRLVRIQLEVLAWRSGTADIAVHQDDTAFQISAYTVSNGDGSTVPWSGIRPLSFQDLPPALSAIPALVVEEDGMLLVRLDSLVSDEAPESLTWSVASDSVVEASVSGQADSVFVLLIPAADYAGTASVQIRATDPGGGSATVETSLQVLPVNDPPVIEWAPEGVTIVFEDFVTDGALLTFPSVSDVDDHVNTITWEAEGSGEVLAEIVEGGIQVTVPVGWVGEEVVLVRAVDPKGLFDSAQITVKRDTGSGLVGDFDNDGSVGFEDFLMFVSAFGKPDADPVFDLTGDGSVNFEDFLEFVQHFGETSE